MADNNLRDSKQGSPPGKDIPVKDIYSPPFRPVVERPNDNDFKFAPRFPQPSEK